MHPSERPASTSPDRSARGRGGFTLLEVLAAVAILGILYSVLATVAIQSVRTQGINDRRLRAGIVADRALTEVEASLLNGVFPELGTEESEEGDFAISTEVLEWNAFEADQLERPPPSIGPGADPDPSAPSNTLSLVATEATDLVDMLATIRVTVSWLDGDDEMAVTRTTFALDLTKATEAFGTGETSEGATGEGDPPTTPDELLQRLQGDES